MTYPFNQHIEQLTPYQPGRHIDEVMQKYDLKKVVKLASNENPLGPSPRVLDAIKTSTFSLERYPDGDSYELKQALASHLDVQVKQLTLGNGSDSLFEALLRIFVDPQQNEHVLVSEYTFAAYPIACAALNIPCQFAESKSYGHDLNQMLQCLDANTRLIFIANPNNPTGTCFKHQELLDFLEKVPKETYVVLDEAYYEYAQLHDCPEAIPLLAKYPNLIITRTFSKAYGLAGLRIGYAIASEEIAEKLNRIRLPFNVNSLAQKLAQVALADQKHVQKSIKVNQSGLQQWHQALNKLRLDYIHSVTNFVTVKFDQPGEEIFQKLLERGVIVRPLQPYQLPQHLRISIGTEAENNFAIEQLIQILEQNHE